MILFQNEDVCISTESVDKSHVAQGTRRATVVATAMVAVVPPASEILQNSLLAQESGKKNSSHMMEVPSSSPCPVAKKKHSDTKRTNETTTTEVANDVHHGDTNNVVPNNLKLYPMIEIKEVACYLSLLEGGDVQDKLEFVFRVYDSDNNQYLDQQVSC